MIKYIIFNTFIFSLLFAALLYSAGVRHAELGQPFIAFLRNCDLELQNFKIEIPDIPTIPSAQNIIGDVNIIAILGALVDIFNAIIDFFNILITTINIIADVINVVIQVIQFITIVLHNLVNFKGEVIRISTTSSSAIQTLF